MTIFLTIAIIFLTILSLYASAFDNVPEGWEDGNGFHEGHKL